MQAAGFDYVPAVDHESEEHNRLLQNSLPIDERASWYAAESGQPLPGTGAPTNAPSENSGGCRGEAARNTLFLNHFPEGFPDVILPKPLSDAVDQARTSFEDCRSRSDDPTTCDSTSYEAAMAAWTRAWELAVVEQHFAEIAAFGMSSADL